MKDKEVRSVLLKLMKEHDVSTSDLAFNNVEESFKETLEDRLGKLEYVIEAERTEGSGDYDGAQSVLFFPAHNVYISIEGYYTSNDGCDFNGADVFIVEPKEIVTTVFVPKKLK